jgi:hypothetical protein
VENIEQEVDKPFRVIYPTRRSEPAGMRNLSILEFRDFEPAGDNDPEVEAGQEMIDREIVELWGDACPPLFRVVLRERNLLRSSFLSYQLHRWKAMGISSYGLGNRQHNKRAGFLR